MPDWLENFDHKPDVDDADGQLAEDRACKPGYGRAPLVSMLRRPFRAMRLGIGIGAFVECHPLGGGGCKRRLLSVALCNRVAAFVDKLAELYRLGSRVLQANGVDRAQSHVAAPAVNGKAENPRAADVLAVGGDLQVEIPAIGIKTGGCSSQICLREPVEHTHPPTHQNSLDTRGHE